MNCSTWLGLLLLALVHNVIARPAFEPRVVNESKQIDLHASHPNQASGSSSHLREEQNSRPSSVSQNSKIDWEQNEEEEVNLQQPKTQWEQDLAKWEEVNKEVSRDDERYITRFGPEWISAWRSDKQGSEYLKNYSDWPIALQRLTDIYGDELRKQGIWLTIDEEKSQLRRGINGQFDKVLRMGDAETKAQMARANFDYYNSICPWHYAGRIVP